MISLGVILKHENTNNLNDLVLQVSGDTFGEICIIVNTFIEDYNHSQALRNPPEPLVFDWIFADREDLDGSPSEIHYGAEPEDDEEDWRSHS